MSLFQTSVLKKYLKGQDQKPIEDAFVRFKQYFHDPERQANIRAAKEEQFQEGFLRELFVNILGYTINPEPNYNLTTEFKNLVGSKKADGAILSSPLGGGREGAKATAVIELKGTDTTDLEKINNQAFSYKNNQPSCQYVITSNFEKLRFYIQNAIDHIEFNLFSLGFGEFEVLWLCLHKDNILNDVPLKAKQDSLLEEENITKKLYKDYKAFKTALWQNLVANHPEHNQLWLFKKTQKLLDRLLFIFFAEDKGLLPPNSISEIVKQWETLKALDEYKPLYDRLRKYFGYLNSGHKGQKHEIFAYNGGLFAPDAFLDTEAHIDDDIIHTHILNLTNYDFASEVDVNILGHIFEHSLNEIEEITAQLQGTEADKTKSKRKKDGVFYTPKYITKYIVDNTVGKLCNEKKEALGIVDEEYAKGRANRKKDTVKRLDQNLQDYREWLLNITICDPACGSGAFLNQALDFLITEHRYIDELESQLLGHSFEFPGVENHILERNLYGVDINDEAVEIAKLSLWLRTAKPGRKLTSLNNNIKCGNSLIDDPTVAGEKAFNWQQQFPHVFEKGGFDVVVGNPPYLRVQGLKEYYPELTKHYEIEFQSATGNYDIYALFIEHSFKLINTEGVVSFILPHKFLIADFGVGIRKVLSTKKAVSELIHFGSEMVFADASTYTCILNLSKADKTDLLFKKLTPDKLFDSTKFDKISYEHLGTDQWRLSGNKVSQILSKVSNQPLQLKDIFSRFVQGIITGKDEVYCVKGVKVGDYLKVFDKNGLAHLLEVAILKPHLRGQDVNQFVSLHNHEWLIFPYTFKSGKAELLSISELDKIAPNTLKYLRVYEATLRSRERGKFDNDEWYQYSRNQAISVLEQPKIITPEVCFGGSMTFDDANLYHNSKCHTLLLKEKTGYTYKSILPILNSSLFWFYLSQSGNVLRGGYVGVKRKVLEPFGIPKAANVQHKLYESYSTSCIETNKTIQNVTASFLALLALKFSILKPSQKLQNWPALDFKGFLAELKKARVKLTLEEEAEWLEYFTKKKAEVTALQAQITRLDNEIDQMVYQLYGLTEEEIRIVEESKK